MCWITDLVPAAPMRLERVGTAHVGGSSVPVLYVNGRTSQVIAPGLVSAATVANGTVYGMWCCVVGTTAEDVIVCLIADQGATPTPFPSLVDRHSSRTLRMSTGTPTSSSTAPSARLLVWPRRKRRPREEIGLVLGWRHLQTISPGHERESILCAGILPPTLSLLSYRQRLATLRDHGEQANVMEYSCLTQSLDIVAIWTSEPLTKIAKDYKGSGLRVITQQKRGFPWWKKDEWKNVQHQQIVLYDLPDPGNAKNVFAHFYSEYGLDTPENEWSIMLHQLNHAQEMLMAVQTGILPAVATGNDRLKWTSSDTMGEKTIAEPTLYEQLTTRMVESSITLLHIRQLYKEQQPGKGLLSWLAVFSLPRCILSIPKAPQRNQGTDPSHHSGGVTPFGSRSRDAKAFVRTWDRYAEATLDWSLGVGMALLLFTMWRYGNPDTSVWSYYANTRRAATNYLTQQISALEDFPAGFKLNESLTESMGFGIRKVIQAHCQWLESTLWNIEYGHTVVIPILFVGSGLCGFRFFLAIIMDFFRLETVHLWFLTRAFRSIYQTELYLLAALFRLFRGKKHNILRQRTDSMHYDAMQLLVGTLGFCICIFLWTTIMVYYAFFVLANWIFNLPVVLVWITYVAGRSIPWGTLAWRLLRPNWFTKTVYLESLSDDGTDIRVALLCPVPESPVKLVANSALIHITSLLSWLSSGLIEALIPRRSNRFPCAPPFCQLMGNFNDTTSRCP